MHRVVLVVCVWRSPVKFLLEPVVFEHVHHVILLSIIFRFLSKLATHVFLCISRCKNKSILKRNLDNFRVQGDIRNLPRQGSKRKLTGKKLLFFVRTFSNVGNKVRFRVKKKIATQLDVSLCSGIKCLKSWKMKAYKLSTVQEPLPPDAVKRKKNCNWLHPKKSMRKNAIVLYYLKFRWSMFSIWIRILMHEITGFEEKHTFMHTCLHPIKIGVWCGLSRHEIIGPFFLRYTEFRSISRK